MLNLRFRQQKSILVRKPKMKKEKLDEKIDELSNEIKVLFLARERLRLFSET